MHDPSDQLQQELQHSVATALSTRKPILTHLNADTSWLLQLPRPTDPKSLSGRRWYNILIDPWFQGPQNDVASWFSSQWHAVQSSVQTIAELNSLLLEIEILDYTWQAHNQQREWQSEDIPPRYASVDRPLSNFIDVVVISHEFTDHCHKETLLEISSDVPVLATTKAANLIRSWKHFSNVLDMPPFSFDTDWRTTSSDSLPPWLGISRATTKSDALYYHSAVLIAVDSTVAGFNGIKDEPGSAHALVYSPHGIHAEDLQALPAASPPLKTLALLHGLHDISLAKVQLNLGARNALKAQKILDAKYWVGTHDEVKVASGLVAPFIKRKVVGLQGLLNQTQNGVEDLSVFEDAAFVDLRSGHSLLLEA